MKSLKEQAEFFRLSLAISQSSINEVVAWADEVILSSKEPIPEIIEVALAVYHPVDEMMRFLKLIPGNADGEKIAHQVLFQLFNQYDEGTFEPLRFLEILCRFYKEAHLSENEAFIYYQIDDEIDLYHQGIFSREDLSRFVKELRNIYRSIDNESCEYAP